MASTAPGRHRLRAGFLLVVLVLLLIPASQALALPEDEEEREKERERSGQVTPLEMAREESGVARRPQRDRELPAGRVRLSSAELVAASGSALEVSVVLDRAVRRATLELTLPALWLARASTGDLPYAAVAARGRGTAKRSDARRSDQTVTFAFDGAQAGDHAEFALRDIGIPAGTYELPFRWTEAGAAGAKGTLEVVFYAPTREAAGEGSPWGRFPTTSVEQNVTADGAEESETFVTVVPGNARRFVVGANGGGGYNAWVTNDGGVTYAKAGMPTAVDAPGEAGPEVGSLCCDPMSAADAAGNVWYGGLALSNGAGNPSRTIVARLAPGATAFQSQTVGLPARTAGTQDKPMMTIDNAPASPTFGRLYVIWNEPAGGGINVVLSQCDTRPGGVANVANCDNADSWTLPVSVTPATGSYIYADVAVGPSGQVYVVWWDYSAANAIRGDVCLPASQNCASAAGWGTPQTIATLDATGGTPIPFACPIVAQPGGRASTSPQVDVDRSEGPNSGRVYVTWSDLRTGSGVTKCAGNTAPLPTHLSFDSFVASAAAGLPGSAAPSPTVGTRLITDGEGGGQSNSDDWFSWLAVDQTNGQAWADVYSSRDDASRATTNFYARSVTPDGAGHTLGALTKVSTAASNYSTNPCCGFGNDYGDYTGLDATDGVALPVWSDRRAGGDGEAFTVVESRPGIVGDPPALDDSAAAGGDGDGALEPGESFRLTQPLRNPGFSPATGVTATLDGSAAALTLETTTSAYPDIAVGATQANATPFTGRLGTATTCGAPLPLALQIATAQGAFTVPVTVPTGAPGPLSQPAVSPNAAIPDNNATGVSSPLSASGVGILKELSVRMTITHTFDGDLRVSLRSPTGTIVPLVTGRGGSGNDFTSTVFDDGAATAIAAGAAPFTGTFRPESPLAALRGEDADGTWNLVVVDSAASDAGTLVSWGLDLRGSACSVAQDTTPPQTTIDAGPADGATVETATPQFAFSASEAGSTFDCRVDGGSFAACTSPLTTAVLADGSHSFAVRAVDVAGNADASPAARSFTVSVPTAPTPTSTPTAPATPAATASVTPGPSAALAGVLFGAGRPGRVRVSRTGVARLPRPVVSCPASGVACRVTATVSARLPRNPTTRRLARSPSRVARRAVSLDAGRSGTVRFTLSRKALAGLRRLGTLRATVVITGVRGARSTTRTVTVTLLPPRAR